MERRCFVCEHVFVNERPVCHIVFFEDGEIQVDCGEDDHGDGDDFAKSFRPVGLSHIVARDKTIEPILAHEEPGFSFGRMNLGSQWKKFYI